MIMGEFPRLCPPGSSNIFMIQQHPDLALSGAAEGVRSGVIDLDDYDVPDVLRDQIMGEVPMN